MSTATATSAKFPILTNSKQPRVVSACWVSSPPLPLGFVSKGSNEAADKVFDLATGIVISLTLEVDKMSYAVLNPEYKDLLLAIPPPPGFKLPPQLQDRYNALQKQPGVLDQALKDFIETAQSYYAEVRPSKRRETPPVR